MNAVFIVLIFVVVIVIVLMTDLITSVQILSLLASVAVVYRCFSDSPLPMFGGEKPAAETKPATPVINDPENFAPDAFYGPEYTDYNSFKYTYNNVYGPQSPPAPGDNYTRSVDDMSARMAARRSRDRQCMDGMVTKNANYYKYHYGNEFADYENRPWWGRNEY